MRDLLNPEKALIFRITHRNNLPWILANGLHCRNSNQADPNFISIGNPDLISERRHHRVPAPPGGSLGDYIPFYFTPFSVMLLNIKTGYRGIPQRRNDEIAILVSSLRKIKLEGIRFLFTDRHAYLRSANFFCDLADLDKIDWAILQNRDFKRDINDLGKMERYQAEALVHRYLPTSSLLGIVCYNVTARDNVRNLAQSMGVSLNIISQSGWYF